MSSLGVVLPPDLPTSEVRPFIAEAEARGFDELWVVEDCFLRGGVSQASVALAMTTRLHIGIGILPAGARNAAFTAMEIATLADLFPGRLTVGIGHGMPAWMSQVSAWPASPVMLLSELLDVIRRLLSGDQVSTPDNHYVRLTNVQLPIVPEIAPLVLAGVRGQNSVARAGTAADGVVLAEPVTPEYVEVVQSGLSGSDAQHIVAYNVGAVSSTQDEAIDAVRESLKMVGDDAWRPHITPLRFADDLYRLRQASRSKRDFAHAMPAAWLRELAVVGTAQQARERLNQLELAGVDRNVLSPTHGRTSLRGLSQLL